jgi:transposase
MLGSKPRGQSEFLMAGSLRELLPDDHVLVRVDRVLDLSWLRAEVRSCYAADGAGRPGIDPEAAIRLMLAGFLLGIVHDRRLMREAQVNIAIRWFAGYGLQETLPDHSSLTRIRQRWGAELFRKIFTRTVQACLTAGIAKGEVVHIDATLVRADVGWESLGVQHADAVLAQNGDGASDDPGTVATAAAKRQAERDGKQSGKHKKICLTDPDATMATNARNRRLEPSYKQHTAVDDVFGVLLDVEVTTGQANEGDHVLPQVDAVAATTGTAVKVVTADQGYAYGKVYGGLERRGIDPVIPAKKEPIKSRVPLRRFRYDAKHDILKCPQGRVLRPQRRVPHGRFFYSRSSDCRRCPMRGDCLSSGRVNKAVVVSDDHPALLRARRRKERWSKEDARLYRRHRWRSEGFHGEAKNWHGLARAIRRGLQNMRIQAFLTAAAINLKRLAAALAFLFALLLAFLTGELDQSEIAPMRQRPACRIRSTRRDPNPVPNGIFQQALHPLHAQRFGARRQGA